MLDAFCCSPFASLLSSPIIDSPQPRYAWPPCLAVEWHWVNAVCNYYQLKQQILELRRIGTDLDPSGAFKRRYALRVTGFIGHLCGCAM